ncbi:MAG: S-methyl-5-thioribose-1-phosphate isomerase [Actinobacteria bacterium]|nr:MAG: S-methyl-5-thioribose-1-phosphate isomerase [Actinomycetota bacterium]
MKGGSEGGVALLSYTVRARHPHPSYQRSRRMGIENIPRTIWWEDGRVLLVDQSRLPLVGDVLVCEAYSGVCQAIATLAVRGAPALGVAAGLALAVWTVNETQGYETVEDYLNGLADVAADVAATRPTAVNLAWGAARVLRLARDNADLPLAELKDLVVAEALAMEAEDEARCRAIGEHGAALLPEGARVLTHCNAGSLATAYFGTALGVIFTAHEAGKVAHVWVDETRPVLQGARLTAWELGRAGVPHALITDNMAAWVMRQGGCDAVIVGADRIAANGDTANKIGTYGLSVLAKEHGVPFYVAAPTSTVDLTMATGEHIPIEERNPEEVAGVTWSAVFDAPSAQATSLLDAMTADTGAFALDVGAGHKLEISRKGGGYRFDGWARISPVGVPVYNPAFDVTPAANVTAIITENGVARPPFGESLAELCAGSGSMHELGDVLPRVAEADADAADAGEPGE